MVLSDATTDELGNGRDHTTVGHGIANNPTPWCAPVRRQTHIRRAATENMHRNRQAGLFSSYPEGLVIRMTVGFVRWGCTWDGHATNTHFGHTLQLCNSRIDLRERQAGNADQTVRGMA